MRSFTSKLSIVIAVLAFGTLAFAQDGAMAGSGAKAEILKELSGVSKKLVSLAEAVPADKYSWRPAEGIRSFGETFMHVAAGNYMMAKAFGVTPPAMPEKPEQTVTDKKQIVKYLKDSFAFVEDTVNGINDKDVNKTTKLFGGDITYRGLGFFITGHCHEHLGQLIAYSRMNGVVPPWSK